MKSTVVLDRKRKVPIRAVLISLLHSWKFVPPGKQGRRVFSASLFDGVLGWDGGINKPSVEQALFMLYRYDREGGGQLPAQYTMKC
ncbi:MAG: hypothetical protein JJU37_12910 [Balneolaceae bacterium]|nr:hypothetical protein [Balneolaceae bacterium]